MLQNVVIILSPNYVGVEIMQIYDRIEEGNHGRKYCRTEIVIKRIEMNRSD